MQAPFAAFFFGRSSVTALTKKEKGSGDIVLPWEKPRVCMNIRISYGRSFQTVNPIGEQDVGGVRLIFAHLATPHTKRPLCCVLVPSLF